MYMKSTYNAFGKIGCTEVQHVERHTKENNSGEVNHIGKYLDSIGKSEHITIEMHTGKHTARSI